MSLGLAALRAALILAAPAWSVELPECGREETAVFDKKAGEYRCEPRLKLKRFSRAAPKAPGDPCPDGYWWNKDPADACRPVVCLQKEQPAELPPLCRPGLHEHLNGGSQWRQPIACVHDYRPGNEEKGGRGKGSDGCDLCVINQPGHSGAGAYRKRPWALDTAERDEKRRKDGRGGAGGGGAASSVGAPLARGGAKSAFAGSGRAKASKELCAKGKFFFTRKGTPLCGSCPEGAATARRSDGTAACVGGKPFLPCPDGAGAFARDPQRKTWTCAPCLQGEESVVINGFPTCLAGACRAPRLPVPPVEGFVGAVECAALVDDPSALDWDRVLSPKRAMAAQAPSCSEGSGLAVKDGAFICAACAQDTSAVLLDGRPVCRLAPAACRAGEGRWAPREGGWFCRPCPAGTRSSAVRGAGEERCVAPEQFEADQGRAAAVSAPAPVSDDAKAPLLR